MRVLVCGSRHYGDYDFVAETLNNLDRERGVTSILHGGAEGADRLAKRWALDYAGKPSIQMDAPWNKFYKRAGPMRNLWMLVEGQPDLVLAFPGGTGTANMLDQAKENGFETLEAKP